MLSNFVRKCFKTETFLSGVFGQAMELVGSANSSWSPELQSIADPNLAQLDEQLTAAAAPVGSLTTKASKVRKVRNKLQREHDDIVRKYGKRQQLGSFILLPGGGGGVPSRYHGVLRSIRGNFVTAA